MAAVAAAQRSLPRFAVIQEFGGEALGLRPATLDELTWPATPPRHGLKDRVLKTPMHQYNDPRERALREEVYRCLAQAEAV
jgi:hypothetical protein